MMLSDGLLILNGPHWVAGRSRWNVNSALAAAPPVAWPAEPVDVAQPAMRRMQARTPQVLAA